MMLAKVLLVALWAGQVAAGFNEQQRKNFQTYLDTPFTKAAKEADKNHDKVRRLGVKDDLTAALARLGPSIERSLKTALLFQIGANESDGLPERHPGSMFLPELHQDVETIRAHVGELLKKDKFRRLSEKKPLQNPETAGMMNSSGFLARTASPKNRHSVRKLNDKTWHHFSLAGPVHELNRGGERRLFGDCTDKVLTTWDTTAGVTSKVEEEPDADTECDGDVEYDLPPGYVSNNYATKYCEVDSGFTSSTYALIGNTCPSYPGFTSDSGCSVQKDGLPGGIDCKFELVVMDAFSLTFNFVFEIGYGCTGDSEDLVARATFGMYTSQLPRPCLGVGDTACEIMAVLSIAMNTFVDIGGSLAGPAMAGTLELFPTRFSFPAGYDGTDGELSVPPKQLFRIPLTPTGGVGAETQGISLEEGFCLSTIGTQVLNLGKLTPALKLLGFALSLSGSDVCVKAPGVERDGSSLKMGLQVEGYALDKTKVSIDKLWGLFPPTFKPLVEGLTDPFEMQGLKDLFNEGGDDSLNAMLVDTIAGALPDASVTISLDVAKLVGDAGGVDNGVVVQDGDSYIFKIDNVFKTERRLSPSEPHDMVTFDFPPSFFAEQRRLHAERRLQAEASPDHEFPVTLAPLIKEGSACHLTITGMPKTLQCDFVLGLGDVVEAKLRANTQLGYDMDGSSLILCAGFGFTIGMPEPDGIDQSVKDAVGKLEEILDIGAMIDASMAGGVKMLPTSLSVPPTYNVKWNAVQPVARVHMGNLKTDGLCITTMQDLEGVSPGILDLIKTVNKFTGAVGGDACIKSPGLDLDTGFKMDMIAGGEVFNKDKVNIWPIVKMIGSLSPDLGLLITIADAVMTQDILDTINSAAASFMPEMIDITFNIGEALFKSLSEERRLEATSHNGRRLNLASFLCEDGTFNLGGFPASAAPGSTAVAGEDGCTTSGGTSGESSDESSGGSTDESSGGTSGESSGESSGGSSDESSGGTSGESSGGSSDESSGGSSDESSGESSGGSADDSSNGTSGESSGESSGGSSDESSGDSDTSPSPSATSPSPSPSPSSYEVQVSGEATMVVENAAEFVASAEAKEGVEKAIAAKAAVMSDQVDVTLSLVASEGRRLSSGTVKTEFTITLPADGSSEAASAGAALVETLESIDATELSESIVAMVAEETGTTYGVTVEALTAEEPVVTAEESVVGGDSTGKTSNSFAHKSAASSMAVFVVFAAMLQ